MTSNRCLAYKHSASTGCSNDRASRPLNFTRKLFMTHPRCTWQRLEVVATIAIAFSIGRQCCAAPAAAGDSQALTACTTAVARALPLVQKAASNYPKNRNCFSCHHQTLPMVAMVAAREGGATVDDKLLHGQAE